VYAGVWLRAKETEISAVLWVMWLGKDFTFSLVVISLYRMVMPIGTPFLKEKINN